MEITNPLMDKCFKRNTLNAKYHGFTVLNGEYIINFGDRPFKFAPPSDSYVSVEKANLENLELLE